MDKADLQPSYNCGVGTVWTKHGTRDGLVPNWEQYDLNGNANEHISVVTDGLVVTGVHYTIHDDAHGTFHLHYHTDTNRFNIDFARTRNPQTIDVGAIKTRLATWCVVSQYDVDAPQGEFLNLGAWQAKVADEEQKRSPKLVQQKEVTKKGKKVTRVTFSLTGGGKY